MIPRSFYFLRHGETDWNVRQVMQGFTDIPLNSNGRAQAESVAGIIAGLPISRIVASPLSRARETADIVNRALGLPLDIDEGLKERNFGTLEGKTIGEFEQIKSQLIAQGLPVEENGYPCPDGAESYNVFKNRVVGSISAHLSALAAHENILFVAHGGLYRVLRRSLFSVVDQSPNACPYHFEQVNGSWRLNRITG